VFFAFFCGEKIMTAGEKFRKAVEDERPLQVVGTLNAYSAILAKAAGFRALYLSGAGVANASYGWPDLGLTTLRDVLEDARRVAAATDLPLLVDADTGWDSPFMSARAAREFCQAGAAGMHLEDQVVLKRCGHRPNKKLVVREEMCDRIRAAVDARPDPSFVVMARTDALAVEGMDRAVSRAREYVEAGADMVFPEALGALADYERFVKAVGVPVLANITEFGKTPMFTAKELAGAGVRLALYPLSAFRAMSSAAEKVYGAIRRDGTQKAVVETMQTREELYKHLDYQSYEQEMDRLIQEGNHDDAG
jgi:methylisocitrate lyase